MKNRLLKMMPNILKLHLKKIYSSLLGIIDKSKIRDSMIPPESMIFVGTGNFVQIGEAFKKYFIELGNLQPHDCVLDVGCGIGRMAIPLTNYLTRKGRYGGFDIVKMGIDRCQNHISPLYSNFHFLHCDVYNKHYNPDGKTEAQDFRFPFDDEFFDFVFLTSVFTHMLLPDVENYMSEISRVLKKGGKCLITFFILNDESIGFIHSGKSTHDFAYEIDGGLATNKNKPEAAIAYDEKVVKSLFDKNGLLINEPIHYGSWCKRQDFLTHQDLIVAEKNAESSS